MDKNNLKMTAYLIDLDGTFFYHGTNDLAPMSMDIVKNVKRNGGKLYFITARKEDNDPPSLNLKATRDALNLLSVDYELIVEDVPSPRVLVNDEGAVAVNVSTDEGILSRTSDELGHSIHNALAGLIWVNARFDEPGDADDFVQTILVANSLLKSGGFEHADIVKSFRSTPPITMNQSKLSPSGIDSRINGSDKLYKGQICKILSSSDPLYRAKDGVSDGAAMRTLGIAAFFVNDFKSLVHAAYEIAAVTHASVEAKLSSVLTALRYRQIFMGDHFATPITLRNQLVRATTLLGLKESARFFLERVALAASITSQISSPTEQLIQLARNVGIDHICWSTPVSATFWSFHGEHRFRRWFQGAKYKNILIEKTRAANHGAAIKIDASTYKTTCRQQDIEHLKKIGEYDEFLECHAYHYGQWIDIDTFFSIAVSMLAAKNGLSGVYLDLRDDLSVFNVDISAFANAFADRLVNRKTWNYSNYVFYRD